MLSMERYVQDVMGHIHAPQSKLQRFELWLRARIHRCLETGKDMGEIALELGEPQEVARAMMVADSKNAVGYAGAFRRVPAFMVDLMLWAACAVPPTALGIAICEESNGHPVPVFITLSMVVGSIFGFLAFFAFKEANQGATPGKRLLGLRVIRQDGRPVTLKDAVLRALFFITPLAPFDLVCVLLNKRRRRLSDFLAGTLVIKNAD